MRQIWTDIEIQGRQVLLFPFYLRGAGYRFKCRQPASHPSIQPSQPYALIMCVCLAYFKTATCVSCGQKQKEKQPSLLLIPSPFLCCWILMQYDQKCIRKFFISFFRRWLWTLFPCLLKPASPLPHSLPVSVMPGNVLLTSITLLAYFRSFPRTIELQ